MSEHWPPEWDDPEEEEEFPGPAGQSDPTVLAEDREAQLSAVAAYLASVPVPALPDAVEARISAALTAEDAVRPRLPVPLPRPAPRRTRGRRRQAGGHRRPSDGRRRGDFLRRPAANVGLLVVCLGLAGLGFALAQGSGQESFSSSVAAGPAAAPSPTAANAAGSSAVGSGASSASGAVKPGPQASSASAPGARSATFSVTASGTKYERATLAEQVRARVAGSPASLRATSGAALRGCVLHLTGGVAPRLVDRATYQGEPAYVIASSTRVWVVGLGCTAAKTELVVSVALAGLPGNLRALVSVEQ